MPRQSGETYLSFIVWQRIVLQKCFNINSETHLCSNFRCKKMGRLVDWYRAGRGARVREDADGPSGRIVMMNTQTRRNSLHTWIILVIVEQHLVQIGRIDGQTEHLS